MKKLLAVLLVLTMVFTLAACGGKSKKDGDAGKYMLVSVELDGEELDKDEMIDEFGDDSYIEIEDDGTATMKIDGEKMDMEYEDGEIWEVDDEDNAFEIKIKNGTVTITVEDNGEMVLTFEKEEDEPEETKGDKKKGDDDIEGTYYFSYMTMDGEKYDIDAIADEAGDDVAESYEEMYVEITGKDTAEMYNGYETQELEFEDGEIWPVDEPDDTLEYEIDGDTFTLIDEDGEVIVFEK